MTALVAARAPGAVRPLRRTELSMQPIVADDEALAAAFASKQRWAFEEAYRRYGALLYSTALRVLNNAEDAEDCVQDALTRVWRSPDAYSRTRGAVRSFLVVCVRNEAITRLRAKARRSRLSERLAAEPQEHEELHVDDVVETDRLRRALASLPVEQREPIELAYYQQKTHTEIAQELNQPLGTIKSRISLGLRKLGNALGVPK